MSEKYKNLKVKELQGKKKKDPPIIDSPEFILITLFVELLQKSGLPHSGKKEELIERLVKHEQQTVDEFASLDEEFGDLEEFDDSKLGLEYV